MRVLRLPVFILLVSVVIALSGCVTGNRISPSAPFERVLDGQRVGFNEMIRDLGAADAVFIGELHDNPDHHRLQLEIIKGIHQSGKKVAIALEMFRAENQYWLDRWVDGNLGVLQFMELYRSNWTLPWEMYDSIFLYARNNRIPLVALNAPDGIMKKVYRNGFDSLNEEEKRILPPNVTCSVDKSYMNFVRRNFVWHSSDEGTFIRFCEAQLLRNKVMAYRVSDYLKRNSGTVLVVVTGVGHAMRRGIPEELAGMNQLKTRIVMPVLHDLASESLQKSDADYITRSW